MNEKRNELHEYEEDVRRTAARLLGNPQGRKRAFEISMDFPAVTAGRKFWVDVALHIESKEGR